MTPPASLQTLLTGAIDFAGLFPPAALSMRDAVARYASYRGAADAWALGRLVVPLSRAEELVTAQGELLPPSRGWRLSVLLGEDPVADATRIRAFNAAHAGMALIDSAEAKLTGTSATVRRGIAKLAENVPPSVRLFIETPTNEELGVFIAAIAAANVCAKIRTGGVTTDAFPGARTVAHFLTCCAEHDTRFKATAGLHHPWRGSYPLTYEPNAQRGTMFGFLNVMIAAVVARAGGTFEDIVDILEAERGSDFRFGDDELRWRDFHLTRQHLVEAHATFALSFGSCSFDEPVHDLRRLALL
ncbi:MAG TPA: hypothetical protein VGJ18_25190 [Gemmatimonadaceae bacterium]|jgi:hypothetical protein